MKPGYADVLDQCIADVRSGRKSIDECLRAYPEYRDELERLLPIAVAIHGINATPDPHRKMRARHDFVETLAREKASRRKGWLPFRFGTQHMRLAATAINLLAVLIITTSAVATAKAAQPGDFLYGLKTGLEQVQVAAALTPETKAQIRLEIARERLAEVQRALMSDKPSLADTAATAYAATMDQAQRDIEHVRATGSPVDSLHRSMQENLTKQQEVLVQATEKGAVGTEHAIREVQESVPPPPISGTITSGSSAPQASPMPTSGADVVANAPLTATPVIDIQALRHVIRLGELARATVQPTGTLTPTPTTGPTRSAVATEATPESVAAAQVTTTPSVTGTVDRRTPEAEDWTRTPTLTVTRRATVTPSITITPTPGTITPQPTTATQPIQYRVGADATTEEASRLATPTVPGGGGGVNIAVRTMTPTFGPTNMPTQVKARSTVSVRNSAPGEIGAGKLSEGPTR